MCVCVFFFISSSTKRRVSDQNTKFCTVALDGFVYFFFYELDKNAIHNRSHLENEIRGERERERKRRKITMEDREDRLFNEVKRERKWERVACESVRCVFVSFSRMFHVDLKKRER